MQLYIRIKAAGKRRDVLEKVPIEIPSGINTAQKLIEYIVLKNVRAYNAKTVDDTLFQYLTQKELETGETLGKIGFNDRKNEKPQDESKAIANALECFEDGIFRMLINETEITPNQENITLIENDTITFIRLVMLAGRRW